MAGNAAADAIEANEEAHENAQEHLHAAEHHTAELNGESPPNSGSANSASTNTAATTAPASTSTATTPAASQPVLCMPLVANSSCMKHWRVWPASLEGISSTLCLWSLLQAPLLFYPCPQRHCMRMVQSHRAQSLRGARRYCHHSGRSVRTGSQVRGSSSNRQIEDKLVTGRFLIEDCRNM